MTEALHREAQRLRDNVFDTAAYLRQQGVFCVVNHLFMLFDDQMAVESYVRQALTLAPGLETRNGAMLAEHNEFVAELATSLRAAGLSPVAVGGSDAHLLRYVGTTYTEAPGRTREEFLANLVEGRTQVGGAHGGRQRLLVEIYGSIANHWRGLLGPRTARDLRRPSGLASDRLLGAAAAVPVRSRRDRAAHEADRSGAESSGIADCGPMMPSALRS